MLLLSLLLLFLLLTHNIHDVVRQLGRQLVVAGEQRFQRVVQRRVVDEIRARGLLVRRLNEKRRRQVAMTQRQFVRARSGSRRSATTFVQHSQIEQRVQRLCLNAGAVLRRRPTRTTKFSYFLRRRMRAGGQVGWRIGFGVGWRAGSDFGAFQLLLQVFPMIDATF